MKINSPILESIKWLPLDFETTFIGVRAISLNLAKQQEWSKLEEVARACPQLGLEALVENEEKEFASLPEEVIEELKELEEELNDGDITQKGFEKKKAKILEKWRDE